MNDVERVIDQYFAVWNETGPGRRRELITEVLTDDACLVGPLFTAEGPAEFDATANGLQEHFQGHQFRRASAINAHNEFVRYSWELAPGEGQPPVAAGMDFGRLASDGRLQSIMTFVDLAPLRAEEQ